jgi:hypothetical protein
VNRIERERKKRKLLKKMSTPNRSRPIVFHNGEIVKLVWSIGQDHTYLVDHSSGTDTVHLLRQGMDIPIIVPEADVRRLTWREFVWFKHPTTGMMMSGKTRGYMAIIIHVFALIIGALGFTVDGPWKVAPFILCAGIVGVYWLGTRNNFTGRWK